MPDRRTQRFADFAHGPARVSWAHGGVSNAGGGILAAVSIAHIAEAANMQCMLGSMTETRAALTAAAHVVASQKNVLYADLDTFTEHITDPVRGGMQVKDGVVTVPDAPGLGFDIDPAFLKTLHAA